MADTSNTAQQSPKRGFLAQVASFPAAFWVANTMEIFERLSWYGWFTVMALYVTAPVENGGLGFSTEVRGNLQGIVPFILYLLPVVTGALADRFGFKKMFIIAYLVMIVAYYALGLFHTLPTFFLAFLFVAIGAAIFKPVVVGTVARVTDSSNSSIGFGIFYMMVNIGGFLGPVVAGIVRGWDWKYVFIACSLWAFINLLIVLVFYREPPAGEGVVRKKEGTIGQALAGVFKTAGEVLGNLRFTITCFVVLLALMIASLGNAWFTWTHCMIFIPAWLLLNVFYDALLPRAKPQPAGAGRPRRAWISQRMRCSNWRFALFLLIMSGFWTSFNQIFITMPEYIRDFTETRPLISMFEGVFGKSDPDDPDKGVASAVATISHDEKQTIRRTLHGLNTASEATALDDTIINLQARRLADNGAPLPVDELRKLLEQNKAEAKELTQQIVDQATPLATSNPARRERIIAIVEKLLTVREEERLEETPLKIGAGTLAANGVKLKEKKIRKLLVKTEGDAAAVASAVIDEAGASPGEQQREAIIAAIQTMMDARAERRLQETKLQGYAYELWDEGIALPPGTIQGGLKDKDDAAVIADGLTETYRETIVTELIKLEDLKRLDWTVISHGTHELLASKVRLAPTEIETLITDNGGDVKAITDRAIIKGRQFNPEFIVNINAGSIVLFQVLVSFLMARFHRFTTMIVGMIVAGVGIGLSALAGDHGFFGLGGIVWLVCLGLMTFSFGEMMASPTSQEYVGRIAPADKKALYMGYYFVAIALGNLFGGILSGQFYGWLARDLQRPDLMWMCFGALMFVTAIIFILYNKLALPKAAADSLTDEPAQQ